MFGDLFAGCRWCQCSPRKRLVTEPLKQEKEKEKRRKWGKENRRKKGEKEVKREKGQNTKCKRFDDSTPAGFEPALPKETDF